jgi:hypothetical protein
VNARVGSSARPAAATSSAKQITSTPQRSLRVGGIPAEFPLDCGPSAQFLLVKNTLHLTQQLVAPRTNEAGIAKAVAPHLHDLEVLLDFAASAYNACSSRTTLGKVINAAIESRMEACHQSLVQIHTDIARLPHLPIPRITYLHQVIHEWWTARENE